MIVNGVLLELGGAKSGLRIARDTQRTAVLENAAFKKQCIEHGFQNMWKAKTNIYESKYRQF
jgi:hypothetical protein